jgi:hypothetical protein
MRHKLVMRGNPADRRGAETAPKFCPCCGAQNTVETALYCSACGAKMAGPCA